VACLSVGSEYFINSQELENKVRDLLPSQGGAGAGFDLSASTQIIPIIDLTESAEGSNVRADLQTAMSFKTLGYGQAVGSTTTIISNTGYWRLKFTINGDAPSSGSESHRIEIDDGASQKFVYNYELTSSTRGFIDISDEVIVKLEAGETCKLIAGTNGVLSCSYRQIADIDGNLTNP
jgi:hypothetical protein